MWAVSKASATECLEVARGPMAGTTELAKSAGVVQLGFVALDDACAKGEEVSVTTANNNVGTAFIAM